MAITISVANQKGGVSKTTSAGILAYLLTRANFKVLAVDMDMQSNLSELFLQDDIDELLDNGEIKGTVFEAMVTEDPKKYIIQDVLPNMDLLASSDLLANITAYLYSEDYDFHVSECLRRTLSHVESDYDFVVIDTPPALSELMTNSLGASDLVFIPFDTSRYGLSALYRIFTTIDKIKENVNPKLEILGIAPTLTNSKRKDVKQVMEMMSNHPVYSQYLLSSSIPHRASIGRLSLRGFKDNMELADALIPYLPIYEGLMNHVQKRQAN